MCSILVLVSVSMSVWVSVSVQVRVWVYTRAASTTCYRTDYIRTHNTTSHILMYTDRRRHRHGRGHGHRYGHRHRHRCRHRHRNRHRHKLSHTSSHTVAQRLWRVRIERRGSVRVGPPGHPGASHLPAPPARVHPPSPLFSLLARSVMTNK